MSSDWWHYFWKFKRNALAHRCSLEIDCKAFLISSALCLGFNMRTRLLLHSRCLFAVTSPCHDKFLFFWDHKSNIPSLCKLSWSCSSYPSNEKITNTITKYHNVEMLEIHFLKLQTLKWRDSKPWMFSESKLLLLGFLCLHFVIFFLCLPLIISYFYMQL